MMGILRLAAIFAASCALLACVSAGLKYEPGAGFSANFGLADCYQEGGHADRLVSKIPLVGGIGRCKPASLLE